MVSFGLRLLYLILLVLISIDFLISESEVLLYVFSGLELQALALSRYVIPCLTLLTK